MSALEEVELAERRLDERSAARVGERARILARRERHERWRREYGPAARVLGLGALGALVLLATVQTAGGDLSGIPNGLATLIVAVELLAPPVVAGRLVRAEGWPYAVATGVCVFAIELVLVFLVGFLLLGFGPGG